ncbi:MAG: histidine kinase [Stomatobaculum sp.]|nr:histidine kinase [Stomatobaculum sp.]
MNRFSGMFRKSFRMRLLATFLAAALIPLTVSLWMTGQMFRSQENLNMRQEMQEELEIVTEVLDTMHSGFLEAAGSLCSDRMVARSLLQQGHSFTGTSVNNVLFQATEQCRAAATFELYDREGNRRYSTAGSEKTRTRKTDWGLLKRAEEADGLVYVTTEDPENTEEALLSGAAAIRDGEELAGFFVLNVYFENFESLLEGKYGARNELVLLDRFWHAVYCIQPALGAELGEKLHAAVLSGGRPENLDEEFRYRAEEHPGTGLIAVIRSPEIFTRETINVFRRVMLFIMILGAAAAVVLGTGLSLQLVRPVERLRSAMSEVTLDHLDVQVEPGEDELGELAVRFNRMTDALREHRAALLKNQETLMQNQKELNETQIRMLQAQLNPHFLGNTLDTMKWIAKINQVPEVAVMSTDLADILRFAISPEEFVTLRRETKALERYIEIQRIRQSGGLSFTLDIPEELLDCMVPKMMLQPLTENAVIHGLDSSAGGEIVVQAEQKEGSGGTELLQITVTDNGSGIPEEMTGPYRRPEGEAAKHHLGLYNVDTILKKHYGEIYGIWLSNRKDGCKGAEVTALLPLDRGSGKEEEIISAEEKGAYE